MRVQITRLRGARDLPLPARATRGAAGFDLHAGVEADLVVAPRARVLVPTGFAIAVPAGYEAQVRPRSGLALEHGIVLPNAPGTIDSDYRGEVMVILCNTGEQAFTIRRGDRIAQLVIAPVVQAEWEEVASLDRTARGDGGFGHTGKAAKRPRSEPKASGGGPPRGRAAKRPRSEPKASGGGPPRGRAAKRPRSEPKASGGGPPRKRGASEPSA